LFHNQSKINCGLYGRFKVHTKGTTFSALDNITSHFDIDKAEMANTSKPGVNHSRLTTGSGKPLTNDQLM